MSAKEGDFVDLHLNDIEDVLLLVVQHKLLHLDGSVIVDFIMALRMFTRSLIHRRRVEDLQLGVESYQKKLNITKPQKTFPEIEFQCVERFGCVLVMLRKDLDFEFVSVDLVQQGITKDTSQSLAVATYYLPLSLDFLKSRAITKYIAEAYADKGTPLISKDPKKSAIQTVWSEVEADILDVYELRLTKSKNKRKEDLFDGRVPHVSAWASEFFPAAWVIVFRAMAALYEKDLDFEFVSVDYVARKHKLPQFLALNPFGEFPAFEDGDLTLFVYGLVGSNATFRVIAALVEKDLDFELVPTQIFDVKEQKIPQFLARNPFGQIPMLEDSDFTLFESRAITRCIAEAYAYQGTPLITKDLQKSTIQTVWNEVESQKFDPISAKLYQELVIKLMRG
ncbi:glutathione S-transferase-like protein [Tanacetum coccineum]